MNSLPVVYLTPPAVARRYGVKPERVIAWIRSGELRAINVANRSATRPRFRIDPADLALFEESRRVECHKSVPRRRQPQQSQVIQFF